jgi:hypothetical protein
MDGAPASITASHICIDGAWSSSSTREPKISRAVRVNYRATVEVPPRRNERGQARLAASLAEGQGSEPELAGSRSSGACSLSVSSGMIISQWQLTQVQHRNKRAANNQSEIAF